MKTIKEIRDVPVGTQAELISVSRDAEAFMVRWIWPAGTYLRNKPDKDVFSLNEARVYFDNLLPEVLPIPPQPLSPSSSMGVEELTESFKPL